LRTRATDRGINVAVPAATTQQEIQQFLAGLPVDQRRLLTMTNREFRAQQGENVAEA